MSVMRLRVIAFDGKDAQPRFHLERKGLIWWWPVGTDGVDTERWAVRMYHSFATEDEAIATAKRLLRLDLQRRAIAKAPREVFYTYGEE